MSNLLPKSIPQLFFCMIHVHFLKTVVQLSVNDRNLWYKMPQKYILSPVPKNLRTAKELDFQLLTGTVQHGVSCELYFVCSFPRNVLDTFSMHNAQRIKWTKVVAIAIVKASNLLAKQSIIWAPN